METKQDRVYALVHHGIVRQVFTPEVLKSWHPDLEAIDITDLDPRPAEGWLFDGTAFTDPATLPEARKRNADAARDAKIFGGVAFKGHVFDSDARSVMNLTGTLAAVTSGALELPQPFYWRSQDNVNVEMTLADLKGLAAAMVVAGYQAYLESWAAKDSAGQESRTD